jgi:hypothetical protein
VKPKYDFSPETLKKINDGFEQKKWPMQALAISKL